MSKPRKIAETPKFKGKVHVEKMIRQLGTDKKGFFDEDKGKERVAELIKKLEDAADKALSTAGMSKTVSLENGKQDVDMQDHAVRAEIAKEFSDSPEAIRLTQVTLLNKQDAIFNIVARYVKGKKIWAKKPKKKKKKLDKAIARRVMQKRHFLECIEADVQTAASILQLEFNQPIQRIDMDDVIYVRIDANRGKLVNAQKRLTKAGAAMSAVSGQGSIREERLAEKELNSATKSVNALTAQGAKWKTYAISNETYVKANELNIKDTKRLRQSLDSEPVD